LVDLLAAKSELKLVAEWVEKKAVWLAERMVGDLVGMKVNKKAPLMEHQLVEYLVELLVAKLELKMVEP
jgi:hypothetical protein